MYLSRVYLDQERNETMKAMARPRLLHGAVEQGFAGKRQRRLWRIDRHDHDCQLLVLSGEEPDFAHLAEQFGFPDSEPLWETRDYRPLLAKLKMGQSWQFRLCANPTRSSAKDKDQKAERGKVFAHVTQEQQKQWLLQRADNCGFILDENSFDVVHTNWYKFSNNQSEKRKITLRTATFEGTLTISDLERFKNALVSGIGRAKAYGCGLLTIANRRGDRDGQ